VVKLLTAEQVAERLQIKPRSVNRTGIPIVRVGKRRGVLRYREEDVDAYIKERLEYGGTGHVKAKAKKQEKKEHRVPQGSKTMGLQGLVSRSTLKAIRMGNTRGGDGGIH
jgi:hypothetical protein